jgi:phage terminase small subunit
MSHLLDPRHEAFCQAYVRGPHSGNATASYRAAGYRPDTGNAARLAGRPQIRRRIEELMKEDAEARRAAERTQEVARTHVLGAMKKVGFANFGDFLSLDEETGARFDLSRLAGDSSAGIRDLKLEFFPTRSGELPRIKKARLQLSDKRSALADLARCLGMFTPRSAAGEGKCRPKK